MVKVFLVTNKAYSAQLFGWVGKKNQRIFFYQFSHHFEYFETIFNLYGPEYLYFLVLASPPVVNGGILGVHSLYVMKF